MAGHESTQTMHIQRRGFLLAGLIGTAAAWAQPGSVVVEDQRFAGRAMVAGRDLVLNGTGVRAVGWFKGYAAGLYLPAPARSAAQVLAMAGPKRLQMRLLAEVPAAEFVKAVHRGVERNAEADEMVRLAGRLRSFEASIAAAGTVRLGDVVDLDFDPARGLLFVVNGKLQGDPIPGDDFFAAVLRAFIGERPYDVRLRAGLLNRPG